ncbi:MAG: energy transducer TonB [Sphingobacteriales bacterium JAD_PAG50586_3]|nr:MAG: energy transducer TonB [Sphingobacteriales bacterium JAD_PAG50586_3]
MKKLLFLFAVLSISITVSAQTKTRSCDSTFKDTDGVVVHTCADKDPGFGADSRKFYDDFIDKNLVYPKAARDAGTSGKVIVQFIVTEKGVLKSAKVVKGIKGKGGEECNKEALRLIGLLPKWQPATIDGKPVRMVTKIPVYFKDEPILKEIEVDLRDNDMDDNTVPPPPPPMVDVMMDEDRPTENKEVDVYSVVEEMPEFPGGQDALMKYLASNVKYPVEAIDANTQGTVYVSYIVNADGSISDATLLRGIMGTGGQECNDEALRVVKSMPKWKPGRQNGKNVRVKYLLPIRFKLM